MDLFGRAKKVMGGWSPPAPQGPQYFRVVCPEGHSIEGQRTESYQALRCPDCGAGVFVLPRSPLPEPKLPATRAPRPTRSPVPDDSPIPLSDPIPFDRSSEVEVEVEVEPEPEVDRIEWVDDEADAPATQVAPASPPPSAAPVAEFDPDLHLDEPPPASQAAKPTQRPVATQKPASTTTKPSPRPQPRAKVEPVAEPQVREPLTARLRRHKTALVAVTLVAVIGLTVANRLWRQRLTELPEIYERGRTEGLAALDSGNFPVAKELLRAASDAARQLGGEFDEEKEKVVHGALEAAIYADLASASLEELIEKRARAKSPEEWNSTFDTYYKGQSFVVVSHIAAEPDASRPESGYDLDLRLAYGTSSTPAGRGRLDLKGFKLLEESKPKKGDIVSFGARLAGVELDTVRGEWLVKVEPDSGVFLRHPAAWGVLGFPAADETEESTK